MSIRVWRITWSPLRDELPLQLLISRAQSLLHLGFHHLPGGVVHLRSRHKHVCRVVHRVLHLLAEFEVEAGVLFELRDLFLEVVLHCCQWVLDLLGLFPTFRLGEACLGILGNGGRDPGRGPHERDQVFHVRLDVCHNLSQRRQAFVRPCSHSCVAQAHLNSRRAGSNDGNSLSFVDGGLVPVCAVEQRSLEVVQAWDVWPCHGSQHSTLR